MNNIGTFIRAASVVVEDRHEKSWLVSYIKMVTQECPIQATNKVLIAASHFNKTAHVLRSVERVGPNISFIEKVRPSSADDKVGCGPCSIWITRSQKTLEAFYAH